jgi:hypothetical protein
MKRYWISVGTSIQIIASTLMFSPGESIYVNGTEVTVVGSYLGS